MRFEWSFVLIVALPLLALAVVLYARLQRQRALAAQRAAALGFAPLRPLPAWRKHGAALLIGLGLLALMLAAARPVATLQLPRLRGVVLLVFDVSGSMAADDVKPSRMEAAKAAARAFVQQQPDTVEIGIVAFSEGGLTIQTPTTDKAALYAAIERLQPTRGTSLASGILGALRVIDELNADAEGAVSGLPNEPQDPRDALPPRPDRYAPEILVLISDGENTAPPDPLEGVAAARQRGVRVNTIGVGTPEGAVLQLEGGFTVVSRLDETALRQIAELTGGRYYNARSEEDLRSIYRDVGLQLIVEPQPTELTAAFALVGLVFLFAAGVLSMLWFGRLP